MSDSMVTSSSGLTLGAVTRVSPTGNGEDVRLIWSASDPTNSRYLIACGMDEYPVQNLATGYVYSSGDSGASWHQAVNDHTTRFTSEESCTYARNGHAYFAAGDSDTSTGQARHEWGHLHLYTSADHGMMWKTLWKRKDGWMDWTSMAAIPAAGNRPPSLVAFANNGTDRLGHWASSRPVAIVSHNGGRTFSGLFMPQPPLGLRYATVWTGGSTVLRDGTALFSTSASLLLPKENILDIYKNQRVQVEVFAYTPSTGRLSSRAVVRTEKNTTVFIVSMAQDTGHDPFAGRLYLSWVESYRDGTGALWLATSDDRGYHWKARPVSTEGCLGAMKLAVAPDGTVGVIWSETQTRVRFAVSRDGGRTFSQGTTIAEHRLGPLGPTEAVSFNEAAAAESQALRNGETDPSPFVDFKDLGLSIRMAQAPGFGVYDAYSVVADTKGVFHVLWSQLEPDGNHALFSRTIQVTSEPSLRRAIFSDVPVQCIAGNGQSRFPTLGVMPSLHLPNGEHDITTSLVMYEQDVHYDNVTHALSIDITLMNKGKSVIRGPLTFVGLGMHSDYGTAAATNAMGTIQGQPYWDASGVIPAGGLQPGATSAPLSLHFTIGHFQPIPDSIGGGDGVAMWVEVYQRP